MSFVAIKFGELACSKKAPTWSPILKKPPQMPAVSPTLAYPQALTLAAAELTGGAESCDLGHLDLDPQVLLEGAGFQGQLEDLEGQQEARHAQIARIKLHHKFLCVRQAPIVDKFAGKTNWILDW